MAGVTFVRFPSRTMACNTTNAQRREDTMGYSGVLLRLIPTEPLVEILWIPMEIGLNAPTQLIVPKMVGRLLMTIP